MGAIAGIRYKKKDADGNLKEAIQSMLDAMKHRSPKYKIGMTNFGWAYGVRYSAFSTPINSIANDDQRDISVIIDGDIFNVVDGEKKDQTICNDAAIILELYKKYGESLSEKIDGSYAIAIWDGMLKKVVLIRDRVGSKPIFYEKQDEYIIFASEIKAILATRLSQKSIDLVALNNFLSYWYVPNPDTLFKSIKQVRPGHMLVVEDASIIEKPYWQFKYRKDTKDIGEHQYKERFLEIFGNAVKRRQSKYPDCGAFLSGGLDTSGVVAVMRKFRTSSFKVFTGGFKEEKYNEIGDAKVVADHLDLDHHSVIVKLEKDFPQLLEKIVWYHDAPFVDTSAIPSYFAAKLAKEHVDVVLTGDFPDQLMGGSGHHVSFMSRCQSDPFIYGLLRNKMFNYIVTRMPWSSGSTSTIDRLKRMIYRETFPLEEQRIIMNMPVPELLKRCLYSPEMKKINRENNPLNYARSLYREVDDYGLLDKLLYFDTLSYATDDLMVKVDRMTAAHGLIAVSPFHDLELIEFIAALPEQYKMKNFVGKYIMKEALRPMLPEYTLNKKKKGFDMPVEEWLVKNNGQYVKEILLDAKTLNRGYFNKTYLIKMVENFLKMKTDYASGNSATIISLITLELWHRLFIDG